MSTPLITPENAIHIVLARKTKDVQFRLYGTSTEKWLFWCAAIGLGVAAGCGLLAYIFESNLIIFISLLALLGASLFGVAYQIATTLPDFLRLRNVEREISDPLLKRFNDDMDLANELSSTFETHHLEYARDTYLLMGRQLRERISVLVGALDKVGFLPLLITGYFSYLKAQKEGLSPFGGTEWVAVALLGFFLFAIRMTTAAQWMEKIGGIYSLALSLQLKRKS